MGAAHGGAGDGTAGAVAEFELAGDENRDVCRRAGMKIDSTSIPYFLYKPFSCAIYQLALGASTEL